MSSRSLSIIFSFILFASVSGKSHINGIDVFFNSDLSKYGALRVGVVANHTSLDKRGISLVDSANDHLNLKAIFYT